MSRQECRQRYPEGYSQGRLQERGRTRHLAALALVAAALLCQSPSRAEESPAIQAWTLPGALIDFLLTPAAGDARRERLFLLVADAADREEGPRQILELVLDRAGPGEGSLRIVAHGVPPEIEQLLSGGDPSTESSATRGFLLASDDGLFQLASGPGEAARLQGIAKGAAYDQGTPVESMLSSGNGSRGRSMDAPTRRFDRVRPGRLDLYRIAGQELVAESSLTIPVRARRNRKSLFLESPPVSRLDSPDDQRVLYAIGPEANGDRRLRTVLLDPLTEEQEESWSLLPGPETVEDNWYGWKDGKPVLIVTTFSADKIGIFERHRLRVFPLGADRTRSGRRPLLETTTASRRWQEVRPMMLDADGDGRDDLVVFQTEGMGNGKLIFEAFLGAPGSGFQLTSRRTVLDTQPAGWRYGDDLTGDGVPDLLTLGQGQLQLFAGTGGGGRRSRHLVERKASQSVQVETAEDEEKIVVDIEVGSDGTHAQTSTSMNVDTLRVVDLDGDGVSEVLLLDKGKAKGEDEDERPAGTLRVVRFRS